LNITDSKSCPLISNIGIYNAPVFLNAPSITRNQTGEINFTTNDIGPFFYYTLDGSNPTPESEKFSGLVPTQGKVEVKAIAYDPTTGISSPVSNEKFDVCRNKWEIISTDDNNAYALLDGNPETVWHLRGDFKMPIELIIDLAEKQNLCGFKYLPDQNKWSAGIITDYEFYVSNDNKSWKLVDKGQFSNIKNNPVWQIKKFATVKGRYIKLKALKNTSNDNVAGYAEVDIITE
jgi:alpha-L-fucosidase